MYTKTIQETYTEVESSAKGLSNEQAGERLSRYGKNTLREKPRESPIITFLVQFRSIPVLLLGLAAIVSALLHEWYEAIAIAAILIINAIIGFIQERKAGDAIAALKQLTALKVKVLRDGSKQLVDAGDLVPGDIIFLETGDKVAADARIIEAFNAAALESALTGESVPVNKTAAVLSGQLSLGDQKNMVFSGTVITAGRISAVVTATGMQSELGKVAIMLEEVDETDSPLKQKVDQMVHRLSIGVLCLALAVFLTIYFVVQPSTPDLLFYALITATAIAVAALPEGLPIILTITSAIGIKRMVKRNVLIRHLMSVETLGNVTVICSDKTGTLTKNQMTVQQVYVNGASYSISGDGYAFEGEVAAPKTKELEYLLACGALCNNASIERDKVTGDPTELALITSAAKAGMVKDALEKLHPREAEKEFTSERKLMSTVHTFDGKRLQFVKGAPDVLIDRCVRIMEQGKIVSLDAAKKKEILAANQKLTSQALRVLAFAFIERSEKEAELSEEKLVFIGLQAMMDPPREEVKTAIERCSKAGIRVVMITGDHPETARAIADRLGIGSKSMTGQEISATDDLAPIIDEIGIYARVNPEHKLRIVAAMQAKGYIVAMTGDGVNDAPALKKADMGVAMGITGTDVAKEASQMVITDDNFASIVNAVEEGRSIYDNIRRFVRYQLSTNVGAIVTILTSIFLFLPLPLLPLQLLWINLSIDGPPALSLGLEPTNKNVLERKPRPKREPLVTKHLLFHIVFGGIIMALGTIGVFLWACGGMTCTADAAVYPYATSMAFTTFAFYQFFNVLNCRSVHESVFRLGLFTNRMALVTIGIMAVLHAAILYTPFLQRVFDTVPLRASDWAICIVVAASVLVVYEIKKFLFGSSLATQH